MGTNEDHVQPSTVEQVIRHHMDAVLSKDPVAMAVDYSPDAELVRADDVYRGHGTIAEYFLTVVERLGDAVVVFDDLTVEADLATIRWHLEGAVEASGTDVLTIRDGMIEHQVVYLDTSDF